MCVKHITSVITLIAEKIILYNKETICDVENLDCITRNRLPGYLEGIW